jgi:hypothetical protein
MDVTAWWMPVSAHPAAVRWKIVGETRAVEALDAGELLPIRTLGRRMQWPNQFVAKIQDAVHFTALTFPG